MTVDERRMAVLAKVKANLVIEHGQDDGILSMHVQAAMDYAGKFQHKDDSYYNTHDMTPVTTQAVVMLASFYYESKDGGTGGFFSASPSAAGQTMNCVNNLLRLDKDWKV